MSRYVYVLFSGLSALSELNSDPLSRSTFKDSPLIVLRSAGVSHLVATPQRLQDALYIAFAKFPELHSASVHLEAVLPGSGVVRVDSSGWLAVIQLLHKQTGQPPVFLVKDRNAAAEQDFPPHSCTSDDGGETADLFSDDGKSSTKLTSRPPVSSAPRRRAHVIIVKTLTGKTVRSLFSRFLLVVFG